MSKLQHNRKHSEETKKRISETMKKMNLSPPNNLFKNGRHVNWGRKQTPEQITKRLATIKKRDPNGNRYKKAYITRLANLASGKTIQKSNWNKGGHVTLEWAAHIGEKAIERHFTNNIRPQICKMYVDEKMTLQQIADKLGTTREVIAKRLREENIKIRSTGRCKGKPLSVEHIRNCLRRRIPTSLEMKFLEIIEKNSLPYKYVGDGSFMISNKNPDFININGDKIAIEVYAEFYKTLNGRNIEEWRIERKNLFKEYGWDLLFFSQKQVKEDYVLSVLGVD